MRQRLFSMLGYGRMLTRASRAATALLAVAMLTLSAQTAKAEAQLIVASYKAYVVPGKSGTIPVRLWDYSGQIKSFQFDIQLPEGLTLQTPLSDCWSFLGSLNGNTVTVTDLGNRKYRIASSGSNLMDDGDLGNLLTLNCNCDANKPAGLYDNTIQFSDVQFYNESSTEVAVTGDNDNCLHVYELKNLTNGANGKELNISDPFKDIAVIIPEEVETFKISLSHCQDGTVVTDYRCIQLVSADNTYMRIYGYFTGGSKNCYMRIWNGLYYVGSTDYFSEQCGSDFRVDFDRNTTTNMMCINPSYYQNNTIEATVEVIPKNSYQVTIADGIEHGTLACSKMRWKEMSTVTITATPDEGYVLGNLTITPTAGAAIEQAKDQQWYDTHYLSNTQTFTMPSSDATVTATFIPKSDFLVIIPAKGEAREITIPSDMTTFKVRHTTFNEYAGTNYSEYPSQQYYHTNSTGTLLLKAPDGTALNLNGTAKINDNGDYLNVFDGTATSDESLGHVTGTSSYTSIPVNITSSNKNMLLQFISNGSGDAAGLDLRVNVWPNVSLANAANNDATLAANHGKVCRVVLADRTLTKDDKWNTLCLPFSLTASEIAASPLAGATIKEMLTTSNLDNNGVLTLNFSEYPVNAITAGKPYIIKWASGSTISNPVFNGVTIDKTAPAEVSGSNVTFVGQYSPFTIDNGNKNTIIFLSSGNKLGYSKNPRELKTFRCHFVVPESVTASEFIFNDGEDMTTGIIEVEDTTGKTGDANAIFDLQGRKIANGQKPTAKGLYIVNGRKVVVK